MSSYRRRVSVLHSPNYGERLKVRRAAFLASRRARRIIRGHAPGRRAGYGRGGPRSVEFKCVDTTWAAHDVNTTGVVTLLNGIGRGDDLHERVGRQVDVRSVQVRLQTYATATTGIEQFHRHMIVIDLQPNGAALTPANVLLAVSTNAPRNLENRQRFRILYDRTFHLNSPLDQVGGTIKAVRWYKRLNLRETVNSGDAGTIADITTGSLYHVAVGSIAAGATAGGASGSFRVRFTDG